MAKKRARQSHSGSVYQSGGHWYAAVMVDGRRRRVRCESRADAHNKRQELCQLAVANSNLSDSSFGAFRLRWIDHVKANKATNTALMYSHLLGFFSSLDSIPLERVTGKMIQACVDAIDAKCSRQKAFDKIRQMMRIAIKWKCLAVNPTASIDRPSHGKPVIHPFEVSEVSRIFKASHGERYEAAIRLAFSVGLRGGELWGLQWSDLRGNELTICRQACEVNGALEIKKPKTSAGIRRILLPDSVVSALRERRKDAMKEGNAGSEWIFPKLNGTPTLRSMFGGRVWKPLLKSLELEHRGFHHARHTAATMLLNLGSVPLSVVSKTLGHSSPKITLATYSHVMTADLERHRNAFDAIISAG
jgi:integrase